MLPAHHGRSLVIDGRDVSLLPATDDHLISRGELHEADAAGADGGGAGGGGDVVQAWVPRAMGRELEIQQADAISDLVTTEELTTDMMIWLW